MSISQSYGFSSSHVQMWESDHKAGWAPKNWCLWTVVPEKTLESPLDCKEIKPLNPKGNKPWIVTGRTDAEAPIIWPPDVKTQLTGKDPDAGKDWGQEEKGMAEDEVVGWHHQLNEFEQTLGDSGGWSKLVCFHGLTKSRPQLGDWTTGTPPTPPTAGLGMGAGPVCPSGPGQAPPLLVLLGSQVSEAGERAA